VETNFIIFIDKIIYRNTNNNGVTTMIQTPQGALQRARHELLDHIVTVFDADDVSRATLEECVSYTGNDNGDITFKGFNLRKALREKNPRAIAERVQNSTLPNYVTAELTGPFLNFTLDSAWFAQHTLDNVDSNYGMQPAREGAPIIVEYSSPNHGKPLHVGHIRSTVVGEAVARLQETQGHKVIRINYPGDVGEHMGKVLVGLEEWAQGTLPDDPQEAMRTMSDVYVLFERCSPSKDADREKLGPIIGSIADTLKTAAKQRTLDIEKDVQAVVALWKLVSQRSAEQHATIYERLGIEFDHIQPASIATERGKELVKQSLEGGVATMYEDALSATVTIDGESRHQKLLATDGTAVYATLDLGVAAMRADDFNFGRMIYVVGDEQAPYFQKLFAIEEAMGLSYADVCEHLATGHLVLSEGKMSSRKGNAFSLDDVLDSAVARARLTIDEKGRLDDTAVTEAAEAAEVIGIGAFVYSILLKDPGSRITFNEDHAVSMQGKSAPFAQYSYARAGRVLENAGAMPSSYNPVVLQHSSEQALLRQMARLPIVLENAAENLAPQHIAEYCHSLGAAFNRFYHDCSINKLDDGQEELRDARLVLTEKFRKVMYRALDTLNIRVVERM
jgi:arginyl-tRNA synthetase